MARARAGWRGFSASACLRAAGLFGSSPVGRGAYGVVCGEQACVMLMPDLKTIRCRDMLLAAALMQVRLSQYVCVYVRVCASLSLSLSLSLSIYIDR